jgi:O-Antigen ligase
VGAISRISPRRLAGLSALFNLPFVLFQVQRSAYDTYSHIFLADHYRRSWFSLWEPRWYLGFSMASYPPLVHQLIALVSWPAGALIGFFAPGPEAYPGAFTWVAEETGYVLVLLAALVLLPLALRAFARLFVGPRAADVAALLTVFLPALSVSAWSFGQLPTLLATGVVLLSLARGVAFVRSGQPLHLLQAVALAAVAGAAHHGVFLLVPFAGLAVVWRVLATSPRDGPGWWRRPAIRLAAWGVLSAAAVAAVLWPFLLWSRGQQMQAPIDHASRHNFLTDGLAAWYFFWPMYGPLLLALPFAAWRAWRGRRGRLLPLLLLVLVLFVLGLGGTTPLPRMLFGSGWAWLTYDRFAFWAALLLLPFAGLAVVWLWRRPARGARLAAVALLAALIASAIFAGWLATISHTQPAEVDVAPIVQFLDQPDRQPYRYFTLGFGDQMAKLAAITQNGTPDGDYHSARTLPELRSSGLGAVDGAFWNPQGAAAARPFLAAAVRYGARWAFVNHPAYAPILLDTGWKYFGQVGQVQVWEHPDVASKAVSDGAVPGGWLAGIWWGVAPLASLLLAVAALAHERVRRWPRRVEVVAGLRWFRRAGWVLTVALLGLWWMHVLRPGDTVDVYFTFDSIVVYAADLACGLTLALWLLERALRHEPLRFGPRAVGGAGLVLIAAAALSAITSGDPALSAAVAAHLILAAGWYWLIVNDPPEAVLAGRVLASWLAGEALVVFVEIALQNTTWLHGLYLPWPGMLTAPMPGASVVQNAAGLRWLRGYGTLPHPNTLGGFVLVGLGAVLERYVATGRRAWLAAGALGIAALVLTFSRASWLGAGVMLGAGAWWFWCYGRGHWRRYRAALLAFGAAGLALVLPLLPLLAVRADFSDQAVSTETRSLQERQLYALASLNMFAVRPVLGIGAGTFVESLSSLVPPRTRLQPVHNVILLVTAETGLLGGLALLGLGAAIAGYAWQHRRAASPAGALWALVLLGMFVTGLFDHYWWTAPPGHLLFATVLGLWAASLRQMPAHDEVALDARSEALGGLQPHAHEVGADGRV